jgi:hypothetical protein
LGTKNFFVWANNYGCKPIHHDMAYASHISLPICDNVPQKIIIQ